MAHSDACLLEKSPAPERARSPSHRWFKPGLARCEPQGRTAPVSVPRVSARPDLTIWSSPHSAWAPLSDLVWPAPSLAPISGCPPQSPLARSRPALGGSPCSPSPPSKVGVQFPSITAPVEPGARGSRPPAGGACAPARPADRPVAPEQSTPSKGGLPECRSAGAPTAQRTAERARHRPARKLYPTGPNVPIWSERRKAGGDQVATRGGYQMGDRAPRTWVIRAKRPAGGPEVEGVSM